MKIALAEGIYWVGAIDWNLRDFHGYSTHRGSSYNSYLIVDDKIALVDTVKAPFFGEMLSRIMEIVDPARIDYVISNHVEMDHSGSLPQIMKLAPNAQLLTTERFGEGGLKKTFQETWPFMPVKEGSTLSLGKRQLAFVPLPMLHWPDSMATYIVNDAILLSNDAFGQHLASVHPFNDENDPAIIMQEATKYYANILMPFSNLIIKAVDKLKTIKLSMIAPSHGIIWRTDADQIIKAYASWALGGGQKRAVIAFNTMWGSTEKMALAISDGLRSSGIDLVVFDLGRSDRSDVMAEVLTSKGILVGSATLNNSMLPPASAFLTYLKGLRPVGKVGAAFGSFGWGGGAVKAIEDELKLAGIELATTGVGLRFVPDPAELDRCRDFGRTIAARINA